MAAKAGMDVLLQFDNSGFATIGQYRSHSGPSISRTMIDVSHKTSTGAAREFLPGLEDGGEVTFDVIVDPDNAVQAALITALRNRTTASSWKILTDADDTITFSGWLQSYTPSAPLDDAHTSELVIKVTGVCTFS